MKIKKITVGLLRRQRACSEGIEWFKNQTETDPIRVIEKLIAEGKASWANWEIVRLMTYKQRLMYAIYGAKLVLPIFEKKYPGDNRLRNIIEAAKKCITNPSKKNKEAASWAAYWAYGAYRTAEAAYWSARAAYWAAGAANGKSTLTKILNYGIGLLKSQERG